MRRFLLCLPLFSFPAAAQEVLPVPKPVPVYAPKPFKLELPEAIKDYKTPVTAIKAKATSLTTSKTGQTGYLGIHVEAKGNDLVIDAVQQGSPADEMKVMPGDTLLGVNNTKPSNVEAFRNLLQTHEPGDKVTIRVIRGGKLYEMQVTLGATSKPLKADAPQATMAVRLVDADGNQGALVEMVQEGSEAAKAGLKVGDVIVKFDGAAVENSRKLQDAITAKAVTATALLVVKREGRDTEVKVPMENANPRVGGGGGGGGGRGGPGGGAPGARGGAWDDRLISRAWKEPVFKLAIVGVEYPDVKHNGKIKLDDWKDSFFSTGTYTGTNATGQKTHGSVNDYYLEQSFGKLRVEGKVFDWIEMPKKRMEYNGSAGNNVSKTDYLKEVTDKLLARDGKDALKGIDGIFFIYAGERATPNRGTLYWPHRANFTHDGKRWPYFIINELSSQGRMMDISVMCHEFGHMLGLPDLYARPEQPGSEGLGIWCAMSNQAPGGKPQHFSAWCKEQLDWVQPTIIDPTVKQKLVLAPIEDDPKQCFKVLVRPDGSEYFMLENRKRAGFDASLPADGLLVWRVIGNRPLLEEAHGIAGPAGPRLFTGSVPFPSPSNHSFTPYTTPSSRSQLGGGYPVHITNITRHPNGYVSFWIGYEFE